MTKEELAARLNGREYCEEITESEESLAEKSGLLVVFGASDDLIELRGAICDEAYCYDGGTVRIKNGNFMESPNRDERETLKKYGVLEQAMSGGFTIDAIWDEDGWSWQYRTSVPHATFEIFDDGEMYCRGIVIDMKEAHHA